MIKPEQVPEEAMHAAEAAWANECTWQQIIAAALNAWPGAVKGYRTDDGTPWIKIPLPTEASDE